MRPPPRRTSRGTLLLGLTLVAGGILPMLAAFDVGPLRQQDINGPPWLAFVAGGIFAAAGLALMAGPQRPLAGRLCAVAALAGLAALGNWIAFGAGERVCSGSLSLPGLWGEGDLAGLACRIPFGIGAVMTDAFLAYMLAATLQHVMGGPPHLARLLKAGEWLILASLAPILLPLAILLLLQGACGAVKARFRSGAWPRNEEFIARQKAKRWLGRFGGKPPPAAPPEERHDA